MKTTVLVDNTACNGLECEWGFSTCIQTDNGNMILLDAGASPVFATNAQVLGIDLSKVQYAVLSHAHYDHANGLPTFFELNSRAPLLLQASCEETCWSDAKGPMEYVGIKEGMLEEFADRLQRVDSITEFADGAWIVPHSTEGLEAIGSREHLYRKENGELIDDDFSHEQSLVIDTPEGLVVFNSCSHSGIEPIVEEVRTAFPDKQIYALVGGLHLFLRSADEVRALAKQIEDLGVKHIYTGHCTGDEAVQVLKEELGDTVEMFYSGFTFEV